MLSIFNDIFEICKIRIELEFINKAKYFDKYEKLKNSLKTNFSEFIMNIENPNPNSSLENLENNKEFKIPNELGKGESLDSFLLRKENAEILKYLSGRIYFNKFFEISEVKNRYDTKKFSNEYEIKIFINFYEEEKYEKILNNYKQFRENLIEGKTSISYLVLIHEESEKLSSEKNCDLIDENNIIKLFLETKSDFTEDEFYRKFENIIKNIIFTLYKNFEKDLTSQKTFSDEDLEILKKSKNFLSLKSTAEKTIIFSSFKISYNNFNALFEAAKYQGDYLLCSRAKEGIASALALYDLLKTYKKDKKHFTIKDVKFSMDIEQNLEEAVSYVKKVKIHELHIEMLFKFMYYYMLFDSKLKNLLEYEKKINDELNKYMKNNPEFLIYCYLKFKQIFDFMKFKRRAVYYVYQCLSICNSNQKYLHLIPYFLSELSQRINVNNIYDNKIESFEEFNKFHKIFVKSIYKPIAYFSSPKFMENLIEENSISSYTDSFSFIFNDLIPLNFKETTKKRIDKENKLIVVKRKNLMGKNNLENTWKVLQSDIIKQYLNFYDRINSQKLKISYGITNLQILYENLNIEEQQKISESITSNSNILQEKIFLNLNKMPYLLRIIPICSDIKFDMKKNPNYKAPMIEEENSNKISKNNVFLYNPWEKNDGINYYWSANSHQKIFVEFYNPLSIELKVSKIVIIFEGKKPFTFPISTYIPPLSSHGVYCKIRPNESGITNILGVKYEVFNTVGVQYADNNGNGIYFNYFNSYKDITNFSKIEKINLKKIQIAEEIPQINLVNVGGSKIQIEDLKIFENEFKKFEFIIENVGNTPIDNIIISIYAYKREDYKVLLEEINISNEFEKISLEKNYSHPFTYDYYHKKVYKKLEFKVSFDSKKENELKNKETLIKPFILYLFNLETEKLVTLSNLRVIPLSSNNQIQEIIMNDKRINKNFQRIFCSDNFFISFILHNDISDSLNLDIYTDNKLLKSEICESKNSKELSLLLNNEIELSNFLIYWKLKDKYQNGKIELNQIFKEFQFSIKNEIKFQIDKSLVESENLDYYNISYKVGNLSKKNLKNLKFYIYLYQINEENIIFNNFLQEDIFYEGALYHEIDNLELNKDFKIKLKLYPNEEEDIFTTCLLIDNENKVLYLSPCSVNLNTNSYDTFE